MKAQRTVLRELIDLVATTWQHRKGQEIPCAIRDTIDILWASRPVKPLIVKARPLESGDGWYIMLALPPSITAAEVRKHTIALEEATAGYITMEHRKHSLHLSVHVTPLPSAAPFVWDATPYAKMALPIPLGYTHAGLKVIDLDTLPHMMAAGVTGSGKTTLYLNIITALLLCRDVWIVGIDLKMVDLPHFREHLPVAQTLPEAQEMLGAVQREMFARLRKLRDAGCQDIKQYRGHMPRIVLLVDELAELLGDDCCIQTLRRLLQLGRAAGIRVVAAAQRPASTIGERFGDLKAQMDGRLCYRVADSVNSSMVLGKGDDRAAHIPEGLPGRAIWRAGGGVTVQTMWLDKDRALELLTQHVTGGGCYGIIKQSPRLLPR